MIRLPNCLVFGRVVDEQVGADDGIEVLGQQPATGPQRLTPSGRWRRPVQRGGSARGARARARRTVRARSSWTMSCRRTSTSAARSAAPATEHRGRWPGRAPKSRHGSAIHLATHPPPARHPGSPIRRSPRGPPDDGSVTGSNSAASASNGLPAWGASFWKRYSGRLMRAQCRPAQQWARPGGGVVTKYCPG